jgi:hypothetical protein
MSDKEGMLSDEITTQAINMSITEATFHLSIKDKWKEQMDHNQHIELIKEHREVELKGRDKSKLPVTVN